MNRKRSRDAAAGDYAAGRRALAGHDPVKALKHLRVAVENTPPGDRHLAHYLYWFSIALIRLGRREFAAKSLASAQKLERRGYARSLYGRLVNGYGMVRSSCNEHDDFKAFVSIQVCSYLGKKGRSAFVDENEREAVIRLILGAWKELSSSGALEKASCSERLGIFASYRLPFPDFMISPGVAVLRFDFRARRRTSPDERCPCGSGLPFRMCCGRTETPLESFFG